MAFRMKIPSAFFIPIWQERVFLPESKKGDGL